MQKIFIIITLLGSLFLGACSENKGESAKKQDTSCNPTKMQCSFPTDTIAPNAENKSVTEAILGKWKYRSVRRFSELKNYSKLYLAVDQNVDRNYCFSSENKVQILNRGVIECERCYHIGNDEKTPQAYIELQDVSNVYCQTLLEPGTVRVNADSLFIQSGWEKEGTVWIFTRN